MVCIVITRKKKKKKHIVWLTSKIFFLMALIGNIEPFIPGANFKAYEDRLNQLFEVNEVEVKKKTALFITLAGPEVYEILLSLTLPEVPSKKKYEELMLLLRNHFTPKMNKRAERYKFHKAIQEEGETISEFIIRLRSLSQLCHFGDFIPVDDANIATYKAAALSDALTDRFIIGLRNSRIQQNLLDDDLTFEKCCDKALNFEMAEKETRAIQPPSVNAVQQNKKLDSQSAPQGQDQSSRSKRWKNRRYSNNNSRNQDSSQSDGNRQPACPRCARRHDESNCPAVNWTCFICEKVGHTSRVCSQRNAGSSVNHINILHENSIGVLASDSTKCNVMAKLSKPAVISLSIMDKNVEFEVDTGACITVMNKDEYYNIFGNLPVQKSFSNIVSVTGQQIKEIGKINVEVVFGHNRRKLDLVIVDSDRFFMPLLGRNWLDVLIPEWRDRVVEFDCNVVNSVRNFDSNILNKIRKQFPKIVCETLHHPISGYVVDIVLRENSVPIFHAPYSVPYRLREKVSVELDRLVSQGILEPVSRSRWASPIVVVPKANGEIRICVDCKVTINKCIENEHYPLPKMEDIFASLANCTVFCVIDLTGAYQQLELSPESREFLTINTSQGLYRYTRLSFGVSTAPMIFQSIMDQILQGVGNVYCYLDDILIGAPSSQKCEENLELVLSRLDEHNVRLNLGKCKFLETTVSYLGHILSDGQIHPNPEKVKAIVAAPCPKDLEQLQSYLGLLNFYCRFLPNLSSEMAILHQLLKKDVPFVWSSNCQKTFERSKQLILSNDVLELYDRNKPIVVAADASPYGVGAVLSHLINGQEKPVLFASCSLNNAQKNYSQVHKEALAIIFALKRFHNYLYGNKFQIYTDHQSLREIFNPKKGTPPVAVARLQRWAVIMSMYDYEIVYRSSSKMCHADALSRLPLEGNTEIEDVSIGCFNFASESPVDLSEIQDEILDDVSLFSVYEALLKGWPRVMTGELAKYYSRRNQLSTENGIVYYMTRVVVPCRLRARVLVSLHENHAGIVRMKKMARSYVWWPLIDAEIENYVHACVVCEQTQNVPQEICISKWPVTTYPFERIHMDFFDFAGKVFLIMVDVFSGFPEVKMVPSTNFENVRKKLLGFFAIFGLPNEIVTDNGPPFQSHAFSKFCSDHGIKCTKSPPYHPQSNGSAERNVQTVKKVFKKFVVEANEKSLSLDDMINKFLFYQRNSPRSSDSKIPSQLIFSFQPKILLDLLKNKNTKVIDKVNVIKDCQPGDSNGKTNEVDKVNENIPKFAIGDRVMYRNHFKQFVRWIPALIHKIISPLTYLININGNIRYVHENQIKLFKPRICNSGMSSEDVKNNELRSPQGSSPASSSLSEYTDCESPSSVDTELELRRSERERKKPNRFTFSDYNY